MSSTPMTPMENLRRLVASQGKKTNKGDAFAGAVRAAMQMKKLQSIEDISEELLTKKEDSSSTTNTIIRESLSLMNRRKSRMQDALERRSVKEAEAKAAETFQAGVVQKASRRSELVVAWI